MIQVKPGLVQVEAHQNNKNLLLTHGAEVDTRPVLEIYSDDVICSHGAAIGQLDDTALFYLKSRGIAHEQATLLLRKAFYQEMLDRIEHTNIRKIIQDDLQRNLEGVS